MRCSVQDIRYKINTRTKFSCYNRVFSLCCISTIGWLPISVFCSVLVEKGAVVCVYGQQLCLIFFFEFVNQLRIQDSTRRFYQHFCGTATVQTCRPPAVLVVQKQSTVRSFRGGRAERKEITSCCHPGEEPSRPGTTLSRPPGSTTPRWNPPRRMPSRRPFLAAWLRFPGRSRIPFPRD